jgi:hypothetical protein
MRLALALLVAALLLGFGALQELWIRGIIGGEVQPLVVGAIGAILSCLLAGTGVALWRRPASARRLALGTAAAVSTFHVYAALPPHRNVGLIALLVALIAAGLLVARAMYRESGAPHQRRDAAI